jgi:hypothetical protein
MWRKSFPLNTQFQAKKFENNMNSYTLIENLSSSLTLEAARLLASVIKKTESKMQ